MRRMANGMDAAKGEEILTCETERQECLLPFGRRVVAKSAFGFSGCDRPFDVTLSRVGQRLCPQAALKRCQIHVEALEVYCLLCCTVGYLSPAMKNSAGLLISGEQEKRICSLLHAKLPATHHVPDIPNSRQPRKVYLQLEGGCHGPSASHLCLKNVDNPNTAEILSPHRQHHHCRYMFGLPICWDFQIRPLPSRPGRGAQKPVNRLAVICALGIRA